MNRLKEIKARKAEIRALLTDPGAEFDIVALTKEIDDLDVEERAIKKAGEQRTTLLSRIAAGHDPETRTVSTAPELPEARNESDDDIYHRAWLKNLRKDPLDDTEQRVFLHTTENTEAVVPKRTLDKIYATAQELHPILADVFPLPSGEVIDILKHVSIKAGDAKAVAEGETNDDEENEFVKVVVDGKDFSKHIDLSYRLLKMAIPAFEAYIVREIAKRLASVMAAEVIRQIKADMKTANKVDGGAALDKITLLGTLGKIKNAGDLMVYASRTAIYGQILTMPGEEGLISFLGDYHDAPNGRLLGSPIKQEDALGDNEVLILDPKQFMWVIVQDIMLERDRDIKRHVETISGFAIAGGVLTYDDAAALLTFTPEG